MVARIRINCVIDTNPPRYKTTHNKIEDSFDTLVLLVDSEILGCIRCQ